MINETTVKGLIQEMIDWNLGTLTKGYDDEEYRDTIDADTKEFMRAIFDAILQALPEEKIPYYQGIVVGDDILFEAVENTGYNIALRDIRTILQEAKGEK